MKYKKALVTGGAGFIGSHIAGELLKKGLETIVLDNFYMGNKENVPAGAVLIEADCLDREALNKAFSGVDVVFHEAARVSIRHSVNDIFPDAEVNIMGTINVVESAIRNKVKKLIYASSMAIYGDARYLPIDEAHPLEPESPYGISKLTGEKYCLQMAKLFGFEAFALRYFNTYGVRQTLTPYVGVITIFINRLLENKPPVIFGDGKQVRDFVSVEDVARANIQAMESRVAGGVFNIGTGRSRSVNDIAALLIRRIRPEAKPEYGALQPGEPGSSIANIARAMEHLQFMPCFDLEDKIDEIIEWNRMKLKR